MSSVWAFKVPLHTVELDTYLAVLEVQTFACMLDVPELSSVVSDITKYLVACTLVVVAAVSILLPLVLAAPQRDDDISRPATATHQPDMGAESVGCG